MVVDCKECGRPVDGQVVAVYQYHDPATGPPTRITLLHCPRCQHAIVVREEERWFDLWSNPETVYPTGGDPTHPDLPPQLQSALREARACLRAGAYSTSALMCRKALELLCATHGIKAPSLANAIQQMKERCLIEDRLFEWADALRIVGNKAAHDTSSPVPGEDARDLLEFTEAILEYVVTYRDRFERFKQRRANRGT
jgi:uncharacterized protein DUF4145